MTYPGFPMLDGSSKSTFLVVFGTLSVWGCGGHCMRPELDLKEKSQISIANEHTDTLYFAHFEFKRRCKCYLRYLHYHVLSSMTLYGSVHSFLICDIKSKYITNQFLIWSCTYERFGVLRQIYVVKITTRTACKYGKAKNTRTTKFYRNIYFQRKLCACGKSGSLVHEWIFMNNLFILF